MYRLQARPENDEAVAEHFLDEGNAFTAMAALIGEGKRVLDLGSSSAYFAKLLARRGCEVVDAGIADFDCVRLREFLGEVPRFDAIVCGEVLGRLREPLRVLEEARGFLVEGGYLVAAIPNVAHGAVRLSLLAGFFAYQEYGAHDATQIRFFTKESIDQLFLSAGFRIGHVERVRRPVFEEFERIVRLDPRDFNGEVVAEMLADPDIDAGLFVVQAFALTDDERVRSLSESLSSTGAELAAAHRRIKSRERELEGTRERALQLETNLEEVSAHLSRADEEMRLAQVRYADVQGKWEQAQAPLALFEETRASRERLRSEYDELLRRSTDARRDAHAVELERERLAERAEHLALEAERLRPYVERAQRAEVASARLEGREALLERRCEETSANLERAQAAREHVECVLETERRAFAAERDGLLADCDKLAEERALLQSRLEDVESAAAADRERLQALELLFADQLACGIADAQEESARTARLIDAVQSSIFWKLKRFLLKLLGRRLGVT